MRLKERLNKELPMRKKLFFITMISSCAFFAFTACGNGTNNTVKPESNVQSESDGTTGDSENETNSVSGREYPHDVITLDFTGDHPYNPSEFPNLESKGTMSEKEIDQVYEGTSDMLLHYSEHNDKDMKSNDYNGIMQEYYTDPGEDTAITHVCIWDNDLLSEVMQRAGYSTYEVNFYYPQGIWRPPYESIARPVYVSLYIDGNGYEYYFADNQLVGRNAGEGISYNPTVNDFIKDIYKIGCYYGNNMVGERGRYDLTIYSADQVDVREDKVILTCNLMGLDKKDTYIIDKETMFAKEAKTEWFTGYRPGESFYDWYVRTYNEGTNTTDSPDSMGYLGVFRVSLTGDHIDRVYDTYWWD